MPLCETENPFRVPGRWLKGALHTHTTASDGRLSPLALAKRYRDLDYDFLFFTDHNRVTRLDAPLDGILTLPGIELGVSTRRPHQVWDFVGLMTDPDVTVPGRFASPRDVCECVRAHSALCVLAHPYWSQLSGKDLTRIDGVPLVEVWNTGSELETGRGNAEYQWDWALGAGVRLNGVAVDDCHSRVDDTGGAWVMVKSAELSPGAIVDALRRGRFYSSCGPEMRDVRLTDDALEVETSACVAVGFVADRQKGARVVAGPGDELTSARCVFRGGERYVRVQVLDAHGRKAWTNPFHLTWPPVPPASDAQPDER